MPTATQANRFLGIDTPLGTDALLLHGFSGHEGISRLFSFHLDLLSEQNNIAFTDIVGKQVTIRVDLADSSKHRYFNGYISRFAMTGKDERFTHYQAEMVPWMWFLTRGADCRIFQSKTVVEILKQVLGECSANSFRTALTGNYPQLDYCVQYRETNFNFVSRLMEHYGIFYFFEHTDSDHKLVLADSCNGHQPCPEQPDAEYDPIAGGTGDADVVTDFEQEQELRTGKYSLVDYNFETPGNNLLASANTVVSIGNNSSYEIYDHPGDYFVKADGDTFVKTRMEEEEVGSLVGHGSGVCRAFTAGYRFKLKNCYAPAMNDTYVLTDVQHVATVGEGYSSGDNSGESYSNHFTCIPYSVPFRPVRVTPKPFVQGPQTAVVVGPSGEEIYTDEYGRVKVQFFWDRLGSKDDKSSCWIRVSQLWAGKTWGAMWIPRIGQEVIVDFIEGDPDRPIITGRVYNADQMPPGTLPDDKTVSGIRSRSSKGGGDHNSNVLTFEDKQGSERIYIRAEKDMNRVVENDDSLKVLNDQKIVIHNNRTENVEQGDEKVTIEQGNRTHTISQGNEKLVVSQGNRDVEVSTGDDTHKISQGNRNVEISMGNDSLKISMGNQTVQIPLGQSSTEAMQSIELKVGQSSVKLDQMGVTIQGMMISIQGQVQAEMKATMTTVSGDAMLTAKGGITMIN